MNEKNTPPVVTPTYIGRQENQFQFITYHTRRPQGLFFLHIAPCAYVNGCGCKHVYLNAATVITHNPTLARTHSTHTLTQSAISTKDIIFRL